METKQENQIIELVKTRKFGGDYDILEVIVRTQTNEYYVWTFYGQPNGLISANYVQQMLDPSISSDPGYLMKVWTDPDAEWERVHRICDECGAPVLACKVCEDDEARHEYTFQDGTDFIVCDRCVEPFAIATAATGASEDIQMGIEEVSSISPGWEGEDELGAYCATSECGGCDSWE